MRFCSFRGVLGGWLYVEFLPRQDGAGINPAARILRLEMRQTTRSPAMTGHQSSIRSAPEMVHPRPPRWTYGHVAIIAEAGVGNTGVRSGRVIFWAEVVQLVGCSDEV